MKCYEVQIASLSRDAGERQPVVVYQISVARRKDSTLVSISSYSRPITALINQKSGKDYMYVLSVKIIS